jgi:hypothetical protein
MNLSKSFKQEIMEMKEDKLAIDKLKRESEKLSRKK